MAGDGQVHGRLWGRLGVALLGVWLVVLLPTASFARQTCNEELEKRLAELARAGSYVQALETLAILERDVVARFSEDSECYAWVLAERGVFLRLADRIADSGPPIARALEIYRRHLPADAPEVTLTRNNLGVSRFWMRFYEEAARLHEEALALRRAHQPLDEAAVADSLHNLADTYRYLKRDVADVIATYQQALEIRRRVLGPDHVSVAQSLQNLASAREVQGDFSGAEKDLSAALAIYRKNSQQGSEVVSAASVMNRLGGVLLVQGRAKEAERYFR